MWLYLFCSFRKTCQNSTRFRFIFNHIPATAWNLWKSKSTFPTSTQIHRCLYKINVLVEGYKCRITCLVWYVTHGPTHCSSDHHQHIQGQRFGLKVHCYDMIVSNISFGLKNPANLWFPSRSCEGRFARILRIWFLGFISLQYTIYTSYCIDSKQIDIPNRCFAQIQS